MNNTNEKSGLDKNVINWLTTIYPRIGENLGKIRVWKI